MIMVGLFAACAVLAGSLAHAGLVRGRLKVTESTALTGPAARVVGAACLFLALVLGAAAVFFGVLYAKSLARG